MCVLFLCLVCAFVCFCVLVCKCKMVPCVRHPLALTKTCLYFFCIFMYVSVFLCVCMCVCVGFQAGTCENVRVSVFLCFGICTCVCS